MREPLARILRPLLASILVVSAATLVSCHGETRTPIEMLLAEDVTLRLETGTWNPRLLTEASGETLYGVREIEYVYGTKPSRDATVTITVRELPHGSTIVFARAEGTMPDVKLLLDTGAPSLETTSFDPPVRPEPKKDPHVGYDYTTNLWGWVETPEPSPLGILVSKAYVSRELTLTYETGENSHIRELIEEAADVAIAPEGGRISLSLSTGGEVCERFVLITPDISVASEPELTELGEVMGHEMRWVTPRASFWKAPWSIEPFTEAGYANSFRALTATQILRRYRRGNAPVYADLLANNLYTLQLLRDDDGLWRTEYTSTWVKNGTGIHAPYVDTRHNSNLAFHLWLAQEALTSSGVPDLERLSEASEAYGRYLLEKAHENRVLRTRNGYFFYDYYNDRDPGHSHVSLNHALSELNYLLTLYESTEDAGYLEAARRIKAAIGDTGTDWINEEGDLHYQVDDSFTYGRKDYPTVTLNDLKLSQTLFERILGETDPVFAELITSKELYLENQ